MAGDIQGAFINQVCCYNNPVKGEEGLVVSVEGKSKNNLVNANQYFVAFMEESNPCVDLFSTGNTTDTDAGNAGGFDPMSWDLFSTGSTTDSDALNTILVNGYFKETSSSEQVTIQTKPADTQSWVSEFYFTFDDASVFNNPAANGSSVEITAFLFENQYDPSLGQLTKGPFYLFVYDSETQALLARSTR